VIINIAQQTLIQNIAKFIFKNAITTHSRLYNDFLEPKQQNAPPLDMAAKATMQTSPLKINYIHENCPCPSIFLQCFDTVGWAAGRASGL